MKIYINNFNLDILNEINSIFKDNLVSSETYIELYTNEGIYYIDNKDIYILDIVDKDIKQYNKFYNDFTLIVDSSYINKSPTTSIFGQTHLSFETKKCYYKLNNNSNISLVIKHILKNSKFTPNDIYFETNEDIDINNVLNKKELIEFLSILN